MQSVPRATKRQQDHLQLLYLYQGVYTHEFVCTFTIYKDDNIMAYQFITVCNISLAHSYS